MQHPFRALLLSAALCTLPAIAGAQEQATATPAAAIAAFEHNAGVHPGQRRNHTKGICARGEFTGTAGGREYSRSALFSGATIPVVARFSLPGGNPAAADTAPSPRGMALEFQLPDGALQHMTMLNVPIFSAATPESFLAGLHAAAPDPATGKPDPERIAAWHASYPDTRPFTVWMRGYAPPASYANASYYSIHAFRFIDAAGTETPVKWRFVPRDGERDLSAEEQRTLPRDFLADRLARRAAAGPIAWDLLLTIGTAGDPTDDPTRAWPAERTRVKVGTLYLTAVGGDACTDINFDPMVLAPGIEASDDPILRFRSPVYAISHAKRSGGL